jgi:hypothetical protein
MGCTPQFRPGWPDTMAYTAVLLRSNIALNTTVIPGPSLTTLAPRWVDRLYAALVVYATVCTVLMLSGIGGKEVTHYIGLLSDGPSDLVATIMAFAAARRTPPGTLRKAWSWLAVALGLYLIGTLITVHSWLHDADPFPGPSDIFFSAFYPAMLVAAFLLVRAAAIRVPWVQLCLDATIFILGFGTFFWFLVIHPATGHTSIDVLKQVLSEAYAGLDCVVLLMLGVLLLTGERRIPLLLMAGFATMFMADMFWSLAKLGGYYASGEVEDVFYLMCFVPWAAAGREQMRSPKKSAPVESNSSDTLTRALPYAALLTALLVLVYSTRADIGAREARGAPGGGSLRIADCQRVRCHHDRRVGWHVAFRIAGL